MTANTNGTFSEVRARLDEIVVEVRKKDLSLEKSLDLYEEAIALGNRCAELVDKPDFTAEEARAAEEMLAAVDSQEVSMSGQVDVAEPEAKDETDEPEKANDSEGEQAE